jgi:hypothetical protein
MTLDFKRLCIDASSFQTERSKLRSSRETTGTTKAIRAALPQIYSLREDGLQWSAIAAALAAQGIVQGKARIPLTTNRLTALVRQIELQNEKRAAKQAEKGAVTEPKNIAIQNRRLSLSPEQAKTSAIAKEEAQRPHRRSRQVSQAADAQEVWSGQAWAVGGQMEPEKGGASRKHSARGDVPENASGPPKRAVKAPMRSSRDVRAFMDRAQAVRRRQD